MGRLPWIAWGISPHTGSRKAQPAAEAQADPERHPPAWLESIRSKRISSGTTEARAKREEKARWQRLT